MKLSQFVDLFVAALYNETQLAGGSNFRLGEIAEKYGLDLNPAWGESLFKDYAFSSRVEATRHIGPPQQQRVSLTSDGFRWVEDELGENVAAYLEQNGASYKEQIPENVLTTEDGEPLQTEDGDYITLEDEQDRPGADIPTHVSSEAWTGIRDRLDRDPVAVSRIQRQIDDLNKEVDRLELSNHERAKVKAITEALTKLVESPEPEWKAIVELLRSPTLASILGLAGLVQLALKLIFGIG